jgi:hypothetical protein
MKMLLTAPASLSMAFIKSLCTELCAGVMHLDLLAEYITQERRWIEGLHLCLNTVTSVYEHACDTLHFLLNPDGPVWDLEGLGKWPWPNSGYILSRAWTELGFNFEAHLVKVLGPKLVGSATKFQGSQCADMMKHPRSQRTCLLVHLIITLSYTGKPCSQQQAFHARLYAQPQRFERLRFLGCVESQLLPAHHACALGSSRAITASPSCEHTGE